MKIGQVTDPYFNPMRVILEKQNWEKDKLQPHCCLNCLDKGCENCEHDYTVFPGGTHVCNNCDLRFP